MISSLRFRHLVIDELCIHFDDPTDKQIDDLYQMFQNNSELILKRAVKLLKRSYKYKRFPFPADIEEAIDHARKEHTRDSIDPDVPREYCDVCYGMGMKTIEKYCEFYEEIHPFAVPCDCSEGEKVKRGWEIHYQKHKYYRARVEHIRGTVL